MKIKLLVNLLNYVMVNNGMVQEKNVGYPLTEDIVSLYHLPSKLRYLIVQASLS